MSPNGTDSRRVVTQTVSLLCRSLASSTGSDSVESLVLARRVPTASRRYGRLTTCATARIATGGSIS